MHPIKCAPTPSPNHSVTRRVSEEREQLPRWRFGLRLHGVYGNKVATSFRNPTCVDNSRSHE